jgi:hypothetical protein
VIVDRRDELQEKQKSSPKSFSRGRSRLQPFVSAAATQPTARRGVDREFAVIHTAGLIDEALG